MRADELLAIDVGAELATLCGAQLQGSWQIPAELVRLAAARDVGPVEIDRAGRGFRLRFDGVLASPAELEDLVRIFDDRTSRGHRQAAIARVEHSGLEALVWAAGARGARFEIHVCSGSSRFGLRSRHGRANVVRGDSSVADGTTRISWSSRRLRRRRAEAWLRTALRFVPFPVTIDGRPVDVGFPGGLYRMRVAVPLPCELAVTLTGETPNLWLLRHGVLAARAVVPGFPAFSAAIEMGDAAPAGAGADELRTAANPSLGRIIDEATRMLLLLVERIPEMEPHVRERLTTLLLRFAVRDLGRGRILESPLVPVSDGRHWRMSSPSELGARAARRGGVLRAVDPTADRAALIGSDLIEATAEQRGLLAELLDIRIETHSGGRGISMADRLANLRRRMSAGLRGRFGPGPLSAARLEDAEHRLAEAAAAVGVPFELTAGTGGARLRGKRRLIGRDRSEVRAAVRAVASDPRWLYPALLILDDDDLPDLDAIRKDWLAALGTDQRRDR